MAYFLKVAKQQNAVSSHVYESFYSPTTKGTKHRCIKSLGSVSKLKASGIDDPVATVIDKYIFSILIYDLIDQFVFRSIFPIHLHFTYCIMKLYTDRFHILVCLKNRQQMLILKFDLLRQQCCFHIIFHSCGQRSKCLEQKIKRNKTQNNRQYKQNFSGKRIKHVFCQQSKGKQTELYDKKAGNILFLENKVKHMFHASPLFLKQCLQHRRNIMLKCLIHFF